MTTLTTECRSAESTMDTNNNFSPPNKSYSLRPRGAKKCEDPEPTDPEVWRLSRTKRKQKSMPLNKYRRKTANARERSRMREINEAFESLRRVIPKMISRESNGEKLTKITTLRLAMKYISTLSNLLHDQELESEGESLLSSYTLPHISPDNHEHLLPTATLRDVPLDCHECSLTLMDPFISTGHLLDESSYLFDDVPLLEFT